MNTENMIDGHEYVDLGLPSGTLWATCNVGANTPTENGDFFAWGETEPKKDYSLRTYKWIKDDEKTFTKYITSGGYGIVDNLKILEPEDDAATANWGENWRMPNLKEVQELISGCNWEDNCDGYCGKLGTSKTNGNKIFLHKAVDPRFSENKDHYYWTSSLLEFGSNDAYYFFFERGRISWSYYYRYSGQSVRAVVNKKR